MFFFFKQKTAYEIYQCDWSSDVCSSDLPPAEPPVVPAPAEPAVVEAPPMDIEAPVVSVASKVRSAIAISPEEAAALAPMEGEDREAGFRERFLSSRSVKVISGA